MLYPLSYEGRRQGYSRCRLFTGSGNGTSLNPPEGANDLSTGTGASDLLHAEDHGVDEIVAGKSPVAARSPLQLFWRRFRKDKVALVALAFIVLLILVAIFGAADPQGPGRAAPGRRLARGAGRVRSALRARAPST